MILILTQCFPPTLGGIEIYMGGLAQALHDAGRAVTVFADHAGATPEDISVHDRATPYPIRRFKGWKPLRRRAKAAAVRSAITAADPSHIIADSWKSLERVSVPSARPRPKIICLAHGTEFPAHPSPQKIKRIMSALAKADAVFANSRATAERLHPFLNEMGKLRVVTPPIAPQPEASAAAVDALNRRLGLAEGEILIATLARLEPRKGIDDMIRAMARMQTNSARSSVPVTFAVAGAGSDLGRLTELARASGVADRVQFLGAVTNAEKAAFLSRADIFAMPTRREGNSIEGFGIVYLEAGWYGTPAIAGCEGGAGDAVKNGETGILCDPTDYDALDQVLTMLIEDAPRRTALAQNAARHAREQLWQKRLADFLI